MTTLNVDGGELWFEQRGAGPPVVFVHGGWLDSDLWRGQVEHFTPEYRAVTFDVRGHGRTGATDRRRYSIDLFTDDLEALLAHLDIDRPILCGLSLGSMVVQAYLHRHPERAAAAILAGPLRSMPPVAVPQGVKSLVSPLPALRASLATVGQRATFESLLAGVRATTSGPWLSVDREVRSQAVDAAAGVPRAEFAKIFGALYDVKAPDLSGVETPTLVVYGDREAAAVKRQGRQVAAAAGVGTRQVVPDAGHLVNRDRPGAFNAACEAFLAAR